MRKLFLCHDAIWKRIRWNQWLTDDNDGSECNDTDRNSKWRGQKLRNVTMLKTDPKRPQTQFDSNDVITVLVDH